jgi:15-cis-phytoene synthase
VRMESTIAASYRFCGILARREARNFHLAFCLLPRARRHSMYALYAFMRHSDDLADGSGSAGEKQEALRQWRFELDAALAAEPVSWPGLLALADTVCRFSIPPSLLYEVIKGVSMDVQPRTFASFDELADYCYHVASVVGICCIHIWGYRSDDGRAERLAEACGIALQLTNILRDVREDACNGRVYLPQDEMVRFGVNRRELEGGRQSRGLHDLLVFQAQRAMAYYKQAMGLVPLIDPVGRPVLLTIVGIYRALLDEIARRNYNVMDTRVAVPAWRKAAIAFRALPQRFVRQPVVQSPTLVP